MIENMMKNFRLIFVFCSLIFLFPSKKYVISIFFRNIALKNNIKGY